MPKVRWVLSYGFCSKFHTISSSAKSFENWLRFDKVTECLKVGTFFKARFSDIFATESKLLHWSVRGRDANFHFSH